MLDDASQAWLNAILAGDTLTAGRLAAVLDTATTLEAQQQQHPNRIRSAALNLAAGGVPVFPIQARGKAPLTRHGFKDATTDLHLIGEWWAQWPDANLGLPTGVLFDVVDVDGAEGVRTMYNGPDPIIDTLTVLAVTRTSRDGGRHLYVPVTGRGNKAAVHPGVDYRGDGGYVVAPPSVGANGRRYEWVQPLTLAESVAA